MNNTIISMLLTAFVYTFLVIGAIGIPIVRLIEKKRLEDEKRFFVLEENAKINKNYSEPVENITLTVPKVYWKQLTLSEKMLLLSNEEMLPKLINIAKHRIERARQRQLEV